MTRDEHLEWAKERALKYADEGDINNAFASIASDLSKHEEFRKPIYETLNQVGFMYLMNRDSSGLRNWITGFN